MSLWSELYEPASRETRGTRAQDAVFECVAVGGSVVYAWSWIEQMTRQERVLKPVGLARYLDVSPLFEPRFAVANALLISALCLVGLLTRRRALYLAAAFALHLQFVARYAMGKTSHGSHLVGSALLALGLAALIVERPRVCRAAQGLTLVVSGLGYSCAALCKLVATGPSWVEGQNLWLWLSEKQLDLTSQYGTFELSWLQRALLHDRALATIVLLSGLLTELSAWLIWWRRPRPFVLAGLVAMHLGIQVTLDVAFTANILLLLSLALPIARWVERARPAIA